MRYPNLRHTLFVALLVATLSLAACGRDEAAREAGETEDQAAARATEDGWQTGERPGVSDPDPYGSEPELEPVPAEPPAPSERVVVVEPEAAPRPEPQAPEQRDLETREDRLAAREAELQARERELARREAQQRARREAARPEPRKPAPAPETEPEPEEVAEAPRPADRADRTDRDERPDPVDADIDERADQADRTDRADRDAEEAEETEEEAVAAGPVTVPTGTALEVEFLDSLSSATSHVGETFRVRVAGDVSEDGAVVIPAGSEITGEVTQVVPLRRVGGRASLALEFTDLVLPDGRTVPIAASFVQQGRSETGKDAATIGGAAAGGAILGRILNRKDKSKGAVIGAIIGAAAGTAVASQTPGEEIEIPEGSVVALALDAPLEVRPSERR